MTDHYYSGYNITTSYINDNKEFNMELSVLITRLEKLLGIAIEDYWIPNKNSADKKCIFIKCNTSKLDNDAETMLAFELSLYEAVEDILVASKNFEMVALL